MTIDYGTKIDLDRAGILGSCSELDPNKNDYLWLDPFDRYDATVKPHESLRKRTLRTSLKALAFAGIVVSLSSGVTAAQEISEIKNTGHEFANEIEDAGLQELDEGLFDGEGNAPKEALELIQGIDKVAKNTAEEASIHGNKVVNRLSTTAIGAILGISSLFAIKSLNKKSKSESRYIAATCHRSL